MSYRRKARVSENTWILVADRAKATIYESVWPGLEYFREVLSLEHPQGSQRREELLRNRPMGLGGFGGFRQTGDPTTDYRHRTAREFTLQILERLEQGRMNNEFGRLIIVAPALMLGVLRDRCSAPLFKTVVLTLRKHLTDAPVRDIVAHVNEAIAMQEDSDLVRQRA